MAQIRNGGGRGKLSAIYRKTGTVAPLPTSTGNEAYGPRFKSEKAHGDRSDKGKLTEEVFAVGVETETAWAR